MNIDKYNPYFEGMVNQIYPPELQSNKANTSDTEAPFLDLRLSTENGFLSSRIYDKRDELLLWWFLLFCVLVFNFFAVSTLCTFPYFS